MASRYDFSQDEAIIRFSKIIARLGVEESLAKMGAKDGDTVYIGELEFEYKPDIE
jgi:GTP-binding protein